MYCSYIGNLKRCREIWTKVPRNDASKCASSRVFNVAIGAVVECIKVAMQTTVESVEERSQLVCDCIGKLCFIQSVVVFIFVSVSCCVVCCYLCCY